MVVEFQTRLIDFQPKSGIATLHHVSKFIPVIALMVIATINIAAEDISERVKHSYAKNDDTAIHYAHLGDGPLVVMIHGFPDYWYTWRHQMAALSTQYKTVAIDQRGYNLSDKPAGVDQYDVKHLVADVGAVIKDCGAADAIIIGHDWGGFVAWNFAMTHPEMTRRLIILNLPHPIALARELANNPQQQANSEYARRFQQEDAHLALTAEGLAGWVKDPVAKKKYIQAFERSDFEAMLNYYKRNYPRRPYQEYDGPVKKVSCSVLMIHGLDDWALLPGGLNGTWDFLGRDLTLVTIPGAGHFVQQDRPERVSKTIVHWLRLSESLD